MRPMLNAPLLLRNLQRLSQLRTVNEIGPRNVASLRQYSQRAEDSSTSNWGTGEPPVDETQTQRGVSPGQSMASATADGKAPVGRQSDEPTSTSGFDAGVPGEEEAKQQQPKKSRTGGDMTDDGQVHTPNLSKNRSTRDMIRNKGNETQDRLAGKKKT